MISSPDWRLMPLRNFWQNVNWENQEIAPLFSKEKGVSPTLSLLMSVRDYFRAISWTGIPEIAASAHETKANLATEESNETLQDFLDDISNFF